MPATVTPTQDSLPDSSLCPTCGAGLRCSMITGDSTCWCYSMPRVIAVPSPMAAQGNTAGMGCLCPACLKKRIDSYDLQHSPD